MVYLGYRKPQEIPPDKTEEHLPKTTQRHTPAQEPNFYPERTGSYMKISTRGRYALRLMLDLAQNSKEGGAISLHDVEKQHVCYVSKHIIIAFQRFFCYVFFIPSYLII